MCPSRERAECLGDNDLIRYILPGAFAGALLILCILFVVIVLYLPPYVFSVVCVCVCACSFLSYFV
jgi:ABC-type transporter Mla subunit MlaD